MLHLTLILVSQLVKLRIIHLLFFFQAGSDSLLLGEFSLKLFQLCHSLCQVLLRLHHETAVVIHSLLEADLELLLHYFGRDAASFEVCRRLHGVQLLLQILGEKTQRIFFHFGLFFGKFLLVVNEIFQIFVLC